MVLGVGKRSGSSGNRSSGSDGSRHVHDPLIDPHEMTPQRGRRPKKTFSQSPTDSRGFHQCPLCGSILERDQRVKSVLYPGKPDGIMEIYGCPYCYGPNARSSRSCPVCSRPIPTGSIVYARFFETPQRRHVHILGCSSCYTRRGRS